LSALQLSDVGRSAAAGLAMLGIPSVIVWAALSMLLLGTLFGVGLVLAARAFAGKQNALVEEILDLLPGINCGACGYSGCRAYAEAVAEGAEVNLCVPGGPDAAAALAERMGVEVAETTRLRAVVHCQGGTDRCGQRFEYVGEQNCLAAHITSGGSKACAYGCLGYGSCAAACPFGAITMSDERLPVIDPDTCTACGICVKTCPRDLISLLPVDCTTYLGCSSHDRGKAVKDVCAVGCIACGLCAKKDPAGAIAMEDNLPVLDREKSGCDFSVAAQVCPMKCFVSEAEQPVLAAVGETPAAQEGQSGA